MQENILRKNHVGIDLGKKNIIAVRITENNKLEWFQCKTDSVGRKKLIKWLKKNDVVGIECGNLAFFLAQEIMKDIGIKVHILNAGELAIIYKSLKKTDKNDCLNIAKYIQRNPESELITVRIPDEYEQNARQLLSEQEFWTKSRTRAVNRLHSLFCNAGMTTITKKDVKNTSLRIKYINNLPEKTKIIATRLENAIKQAEDSLNEIDKEILEHLSEKKEKVKTIMSLPGIGKITTLAILGYMGDPKRFSNEKQVAYYVGLVPRVDQSGDIERYGNITKRGCRQLRRTMIQCAWALVRSKYGGDLKDKFEEIKIRRGSGRAIVAIARKLLERVYHLLRKQELNKYMPINEINKKLAYYKL